MEQKSLLDSLKERLDEVSERREMNFQHPRQGKSLSAMVEFIEMISKSMKEETEPSIRKIAIMVGQDSSRDLRIVETIQNFLKDREDLHIVGYNNILGTVGKLSKDGTYIYGLDLGHGLDKTIVEEISLPTSKDISVMKLTPIEFGGNPIEKYFDYQSGKRKGKYSKYYNTKYHSNKYHK